MKRALYFIGISTIQAIITAILFVLIFIVVPFFIGWRVHQSLTIVFIIGMILMAVAYLAILITPAIFIYHDVKKFISQGVDAWMPSGWVLVTILFWFPGLSIYLTLRKFNYKLQLQGRNQNIKKL